MKWETLIWALEHMKVETGSLVCLGCGYENNCSTRGCAGIKKAPHDKGAGGQGLIGSNDSFSRMPMPEARR